MVWRLLVGERGLQFLLPLTVGGEGVTAQQLARGVEAQQIRRQLVDGLADSSARPRPLLRAEARQPRRVVRARVVAADAVDLLDRHVEAILACVAQLQVVALLLAHVAAHDAGEARDPVVGMHHEVARRDVGEEARPMRGAPPQRAALADEAEQLAVRRERQLAPGCRDAPAAGQ